MKDSAILQAIQEVGWALDLPVLRNLVSVAIRHSFGEKLEPEAIDEIIGARTARRVEEEEGGMRIVDGTAIIPIMGIISKRMGMIHRASHYGTSPGAIQEDISRALANDNVDLLAYDIDSPGGSVAGVAATANAMFKAAQKKRSITIARDVMASAGYWLGSQTDKIFIGPTAQVGSIGVYTVAIDSSQAYKERGYGVHLIRSGEAKGIGTPGTKITEKDVAVIQESVDAFFAEFLKAVARGRGVSVAQIRKVADGRSWIGAKVIELGLADAIGTMDQAIEVARGAAQIRSGAVTGASLNGGHIMGDTTATATAEGGDVTEAVVVDDTVKAGTQNATPTQTKEKSGGNENKPQEMQVLVIPQAAVQPAESEPTAEDGKKAERARAKGIRQIATEAGFDEKWVEEKIDGDVTIELCQREAYEKMVNDRKPESIAVGEDNNRATFGTACIDAIALRTGAVADPEKVHARAKEMRYMKLLDMARAHCEAWGQNVVGLAPHQIARLAFSESYMPHGFQAATISGGAPGHSTASFPFLLADAINKTLQKSYTEARHTWNMWMRRRTAPDFKTISAVRFGEFPDLEEVKEGAEYEYVTIGEEREQYTLAKFGKFFDVTWETIINDDLDALTRLPAMMGAAARRLENLTAYLPIISAAAGEVMGDTNALFDATNHGNLVATAGEPDTAAITAGRLLMRKQTGVTAGVKIDIVPKFILVPPEYETTLDVLLGSLADPDGTHAGVKNPHKGAYIPIVEPVLGANAAYAGGSDADWYMACDYNECPTIEVAFLEGNEAPFLEVVDYSNIDGKRWKVRHCVASKAIDWRGMVKMDHS